MFSSKNIEVASVIDAEAIVALLNKAYRGAESKKGWTTEADLIAGEVRTTAAQVVEIIETNGSVFLLQKENEGINACVNLQQKDGRIYLGMFAVNPDIQGAGVGKQMLQAAEEWATFNNCSSIYMIVISARTELIDWYKRHGYSLTGNSYPFKEDGYSGKHLQPLTFLELEKTLN